MPRRSILAFAVLSVLGACVYDAPMPPPPAVPYEQTLNGWLGRPVEDLRSEWGPPSQTQTLPGGAQVIEYVSRQQDGDIACSTVLTTNPAGTLMRFSYSGVDCRPPGGQG